MDKHLASELHPGDSISAGLISRRTDIGSSVTFELSNGLTFRCQANDLLLGIKRRAWSPPKAPSRPVTAEEAWSALWAASA
jgi:hypothetical protein